jgi:hypothetical protein
MVGRVSWPAWWMNRCCRVAIMALPSGMAVIRAHHISRAFQDHDVGLRILNGRSMARVAHRVASVMSRRPSRCRAPMARLCRAVPDTGAGAGAGGGVVLAVEGVAELVQRLDAPVLTDEGSDVGGGGVCGG